MAAVKERNMSKLSGIYYKCISNKLNFIIAVAFLVWALMAFVLLIFDIVQLAIVSRNPAAIASCFVTLNIVGLVVSVITMVITVVCSFIGYFKARG